ncbi:MAG TPA: CHAT domain-containing protein [Blastocatellia bacterium]|nr:CHAT domain-containing protein [Blastocatellia bacterium]
MTAQAVTEKGGAEKTPLPEIRTLDPGQSVEQAIPGGQSHSYRVSLTAGQYLNVRVEQIMIDASVHLFDPEGKAIAGIDWAGAGAVESLWALAEATGDYRLTVSVPSKRSNGRYIIKLQKVGEFATATAVEQTYVKAHQLYWQAVEFRNQDGNQAWHQAAEKYAEVLPLWRALKDRVGEAATLHDLGFVYGKLDERQKALEWYEQALPVWRAVGDHQGDEAATLYNLGSVYAGLGKAVEAVACYKKAVALRRLIGDQIGEAYVLTNLGQAYINLGQFQAALESLQEALRLRQALGDIEAQARSLSNLAAAHFYLGEIQESLNYSKQALPLRRAAGDRRGEAITLSNIGSIYRELGEPLQSLEYTQQALRLIRQLGDRAGEAIILDSIGRNYYELGDNPQALEYQQKSLSIRRAVADLYGEGASLANLGNVYARMGERQKALDYFEQSLRLRRALGDRHGEALTLQNAGELYRQSGELPKALAYFNQGLAISRDIKSRFLEASLLYAAARVDQAQGRVDEARARIEAAITIIESTRAKVSSADLRGAFFASKQDFYELEIDLLMQAYRRDHDPENLAKALQVSERRRARTLLDSLEEACANIRQGVAPELLARERALRARLNRQAESQLALLGSKHTLEQAAAAAKEVDAITAEYEQVLTEIRASSPRYASLTQPAPLRLREIQTTVLDPDTLLLEYALGKERSYLWAVTASAVAGFELPPRKQIESLARHVYDLMTSRNQSVKFEERQERAARIARADAEYAQAARQLSRILLGPVAARMRQKRLLLVGDGALQYLPFAALPLPVATAPGSKPPVDVPLIATHEVISLPSASTLAVLRKEVAGRKPAPKTIAVLADPVFEKNDERVKTTRCDRQPDCKSLSKDEPRPVAETQAGELTRAVMDLSSPDQQLRFPRLRFTRQEADAITALTAPGENKTATDFAANRATAMAPEMSQYRYLHFATHGLLNNTHPELSGIVLSLVNAQGEDDDGFLSANEIYNLNFPADLIVLSGCRTGLGKELKGEGILSLTRAFMYAGAPRVLVSLWDVNDESTAALMARFYQAMLGKKRLSPAAALRAAQLSMQRSARWRMPYYWSAFVLQGEYR